MSEQDQIDKLNKEILDLKRKLTEKNAHHVADTIPLLISYIDTEYRYTYVNKAYERWFRTSSAELLGVKVEDFVGKAVFSRALPYLQVAFSGQEVEFEQESPYANGTRHIQVKYIPDKDEDGNVRGVIAIVDDVSSRVRADELQRQIDASKELELIKMIRDRDIEIDASETKVSFEKEAKETAQELNRKLTEEKEIRERFVTALSHDLRTPLTAAALAVQLLHRKISDPPLKHTLKRIKFNMDRADRMIKDLLDANRLQAGDKLPVHFEACDLNATITNVVDNIFEIYNRKIQVLLPSEPLQGFWDKNALERVWENLIGNALKYGDREKSVTIAAEEKDDDVIIRIHNEGNPISPVDQKSLFSSFHRLASAITSGHKGWGIGLSLVKAIAEAHHGSVSVTSSVKEGTNFVVTLPRDARRSHG